MNKTQSISLGITLLISALIFLWLRYTYLEMELFENDWSNNTVELAVFDDRFFEVIEDPSVPMAVEGEPAEAFNDIPADNASESAAPTGDDLADQGKPAEAPTHQTTKQPAPVKEKPEPPKKTGPTEEELQAKREEEAKRKANAAVNSAFGRGDNAATNAGKEPGESGSPTGAEANINGTGSGSVGGGWFLPDYAKVPSSVTGSIRLMVKVNKEGYVTSLKFQGGEPPAATDPALRSAVEKEVRSKKFTRGASEAPDESTAYITYRFR